MSEICLVDIEADKIDEVGGTIDKNIEQVVDIVNGKRKEDLCIVEKFKNLIEILQQENITNDDIVNFKNILQSIGDKYGQVHFKKYPWITILRDILASMASVIKCRYDIVEMLFDFESTTKLVELAYLIRYYPNDNESNEKILSIIRDINRYPEGTSVLKSFKDFDGNTLLDLSCGKSPHVKKSFIGLVDLKCKHLLDKFEGMFDWIGWIYEKAPIPKIQIVQELLNCGLGIDHLERLEFNDPDILKLVLFNSHSHVRPNVTSIINKKDWLEGYTALHKAALNGCLKSVNLLLQAGANFGTVNNYGESCVSEIDPKTLEKFMNFCIDNRCENKSVNSYGDFEMIFDFR